MQPIACATLLLMTVFAAQITWCPVNGSLWLNPVLLETMHG